MKNLNSLNENKDKFKVGAKFKMNHSTWKISKLFDSSAMITSDKDKQKLVDTADIFDAVIKGE